MGEGEETRLVAWAAEMKRVHHLLRDALELARETVESGTVSDETTELLLYCWGFCAALSGHHTGEDTVLFPAVVARHPELAAVVRQLQQDHSMIEHLIGGLRKAMDERAEPAEVLRHLDGIDAVMESHFGYEERQLLGVLEKLELDAIPSAACGPLAT